MRTFDILMYMLLEQYHKFVLYNYLLGSVSSRGKALDCAKLSKQSDTNGNR